MPGVQSKYTGTAIGIRPGKTAKKAASSPDTVRRAYAGKYVAWVPDGLTIAAIASSFRSG